VSYMLYEEK